MLPGKRPPRSFCLLLALLLTAGLSAQPALPVSYRNTPLTEVFRDLEKKTSWRFIYTAEELLGARPVSLSGSTNEGTTLLNRVFADQPLSYTLRDNYVVVRKKTEEEPAAEARGHVLDEKGEGIAGATVAVRGATLATATAADGSFHFSGMRANTVLLITSVGYQPAEVPVRAGPIEVRLHPAVTALDETVVMAYGKTTRRLATSSISRVTAEDISRQPVPNPLAALQGLVPGLLVTQRNGLPGSHFLLQLRGINSLKQGTQPLFIVDGVPFAINTNTLSQLLPEAQSVFNTINPADIESIEVLKDADATAIYGSQGANGVILITTRKGGNGKPRGAFNYYTAWGRAQHASTMLNTDQYIRMRREAFANEALTPTVSSAPDLLSWDTTRYTDWKETLIGGTARIHNLMASLSGGSSLFSYLVSGSHSRESTVFPQSLPATRSSVRTNLSITSPNRRFSLGFTGGYSADTRDRPFLDLTYHIQLPPNLPALYDSLGRLQWTSGQDHPLAAMEEKYESTMANLLGNLSLKYEVVPGLSLLLNLGYNSLRLDEQRTTPLRSQRPAATSRGSIQLSGANTWSWIAEPQLQYKWLGGKHSAEVLLGGSFQERVQTMSTIQGNGYTSDDVIGNLGAAATLAASSSYSQYRYAAAFGRLSYNFDRRYLLNATFRRDGSSRYGPAERFASFGALGAGWIFSEERFAQKALPALTYGKLRGSWGITGNDQVGNYQYLDTWSATTATTYGGNPGLQPSRLFNPSYQWEQNRKLEAALELGFWKDRLLLSAVWFSNRSNNQLVSYKLPGQTGFLSILRNIDAVIDNTGWEFDLRVKPLSGTKLSWQSALNLTVPRNVLVSYPDLDASTDRLLYTVGEPVTSLRLFNYTGVNPATGLYSFVDVNGDGVISSPADLTNIVRSGIDYYGGWQNTFGYKSWQLSIHLYGVRQIGRNYLYTVVSPPGSIGNQPSYVLDRWQKAGDGGGVQRYTPQGTGTAATAYTRLRSSNASVEDASFLRLRNVSLSWSLPAAWLRKWKGESARVYVEGQNLLTITSYHGADPESQSFTTLPPLKVIAAGIQLNF